MTSDATNATFVPEPLPPRAECANCAELRRLLAGMRFRIDEVEREYALLLQRVEGGVVGSIPDIEISSDLPPTAAKS